METNPAGTGGEAPRSRSVMFAASSLVVGLAMLAMIGGCSGSDSLSAQGVSATDSAQAGDERPTTTAAQASTTTGAPRRAPGPAPEGMVWIPGGEYWMGSDDESMRDAKPIHGSRSTGSGWTGPR